MNGFMRTLWMCAFLIAAVNLHGEPQGIYYYGKYSPNKVVPLFGDSVNIRENPSLRAKVIARLPITHQVRIKEEVKDILEVRRYRENWYRVEFSQGEKSLEGFVWGGLLAKAFVHEDIDGDNQAEWIVIGISGAEKGERVVEARLVKEGRVISKPFFNAIDIGASRFFIYTVSAELLPDKSFTPPLKIIRVHFSYEACDYPNGDVLLTWNGKELRYGLRAVFSSSEFGGSSYRYIFPEEKNGKENHIIIKYTIEKVEEDPGKRSTRVSFEEYRWDGERLKSVK